MQPLTIGPLALDTPVLAAPIAGFTDAIFRRIVRDLGGCGLVFTEMIGAGSWMQAQHAGARPRPERIEGIEDEPRPLGVQLWDRDPEMLYAAARELAALEVSVIDLNFGCPKKRIMGRHAAGAALLRDPQTVGRLVRAAVRGAGAVPVTAKIRLGPSLAAPTAPEVARRAADNGAVAITVHGRTAEQNYDTPCHLDRIAAVVQAVSVPVIANGDVHDAASALHTLRATGAAGVMVARGALTRPWVFREITAALRGQPVPAPPTADDQKALLFAHHAAMVDRYGEPWGTIFMRKFACRYLMGAPGIRPFRDAITRAADSAEFRAVVDRHFPGDTRPAVGEGGEPIIPAHG
jgi:tRNA-dihydrouridine synthase B